ncbi:MAG: hypothetical protein AAF716_11375 [Cyanobacteria bacterium P01_D01_bin.1]
MRDLSEGAINTAAIKVSAVTVVAAALCLWVWQLVGGLPAALNGVVFGRVSAIANVALIIHAIEAGIATALIFRTGRSPSLQKILKVGLYVFFVGTIGLLEIVRASKDNVIDGSLD